MDAGGLTSSGNGRNEEETVSPAVLLLLETINKKQAAREIVPDERDEADVGASSPRNSSYHLAKEV